MLKRFNKNDNRKLIGRIPGHLNAVNKLKSDWQQLDKSDQSYADPSSV